MKITRRKAMLTMGATLAATPAFGAVNPIVNFDKNKVELLEFGKKTLERKPIALDRVGIRRLVFYIEKAVRKNYRSVHFLKPPKHYEFVCCVADLMDDIRDRGGVQDYEVCQWSSSESEVLFGCISIKPIRPLVWIDINFEFRGCSSFSSVGASYKEHPLDHFWRKST